MGTLGKINPATSTTGISHSIIDDDGYDSAEDDDWVPDESDEDESDEDESDEGESDEDESDEGEYDRLGEVYGEWCDGPPPRTLVQRFLAIFFAGGYNQNDAAPVENNVPGSGGCRRDRHDETDMGYFGSGVPDSDEDESDEDDLSYDPDEDESDEGDSDDSD